MAMSSPWDTQYNYSLNAPSVGVNPMPGPQSPPGQSFGEFQKPFETPSPLGTVPQTQQQQAQPLGMQAPQTPQYPAQSIQAPQTPQYPAQSIQVPSPQLPDNPGFNIPQDQPGYSGISTMDIVNYYNPSTGERKTGPSYGAGLGDDWQRQPGNTFSQPGYGGMQAPQVQQLGGPMNPVQTLGQGGVPQQTQGGRGGPQFPGGRGGPQFPGGRFGPQFPGRFGPQFPPGTQPPRFGQQPPRLTPQPPTRRAPPSQPPRRVPQQPPGRIAGSSVADRGRQIQRGLANQLQGYNRQATSSTSPSPRVGMLGGKTKRSFGF